MTQEEHFNRLESLLISTNEKMDSQYLELKGLILKNSERLDEHSKILNKHSKILDEHSIKLDNHAQKLDEHSNKMSTYDEDILSIKRSLVIIEDAVTNKIPALFDAHKANLEKHEEFDNRISLLETTSENNSLKISILEDESKRHSEQLKKLLS